MSIFGFDLTKGMEMANESMAMFKETMRLLKQMADDIAQIKNNTANLGGSDGGQKEAKSSSVKSKKAKGGT